MTVRPGQPLRLAKACSVLLAGVMLAWPAARLGAPGILLGLCLAAPPALLAWRLGPARPRTLQAGILLQGLYLAIGLMELVANPAARGWALGTLLLSLALCGSLLTLQRAVRLAAAGRA